MNKILIITSNIAPYRLKWAEELTKHYEVEIVYTKDHDYERDDRWLQSKSNYCKITKLKNDEDKYDPICFDVIGVIKKNINSCIIFDGYGPKTNLLGLSYCKFNDISCFVNVDGYALGEKENKIKEIIKKFVISKLCPNIFCSSDVTKGYLSQYKKDDHIYVHNFSSINNKRIINKVLNKAEKNEIRKQLNINTEKPIVVSVGAFIPRKRYEDLIKAVIKCNSDCELYLVGGKATKEYLELVGNNKNIHFIDFVLPNDVDKYYLISDLFVLPSQTDVWGLVINEAMANGLPVISSYNCIAGLSMIDGNGIIYKTGDVDELVEAIDRCLETNTNYQMALKSLKIIKEYTIEEMVNRQKPIIDAYFGNKL